MHTEQVALAVNSTPTDGAKDVNPRAPISVDAAGGTIAAVALTGADGTKVTGKLAADKRSWSTTEPLGYGKSYTFSGQATNVTGKDAAITGTFTTVVPESTIAAHLNTAEHGVYGIAMPVVVDFDSAVADRAAAEHALSITTSPPTEGSWAWLSDHSVHWRPKSYWKPGTKVGVNADIYGVDLGNGEYGAADLHSAFTIGRAQIVKGNTQTHRMKVYANGKQVADYPASYGLDSVDWRNTRSGIHVVMSKSPTYLMSNPRGHYKNVFVRWAVRISNNGEFIHALPTTEWAQGNRNVSHGCVNLSTARAKAYYDLAQIGDPVVITGSKVKLSSADGDLYDWTINWGSWQSRSALHA